MENLNYMVEHLGLFINDYYTFPGIFNGNKNLKLRQGFLLFGQDIFFA